jgi:pimeloyl-ACP methyl ester carboxylesterase
MQDRRSFLASVCSVILAGLVPSHVRAGAPAKLVMVHGRAQGGRSVEDVRAEWLGALEIGAKAAGIDVPSNVEFVFPFYGDRLDELVEAYNVPTASNITAKGDEVQDEYLQFQHDLAREMQLQLGISDAQVEAEYGDNQREKGPLNWEWVQAILKSLERNSDGLAQSALEGFTRDVFLYLNRTAVRNEVDRIVADALDNQPTVVVGHSLGSVVCYSVLSDREQNYDVPNFVTIGSPLAIRTIRTRLTPIRFPKSARAWSNFYDERDVVALYPLDDDNFAVTPKIMNYGNIQNHTDNRHGIIGYLDDRRVARGILELPVT